MAQVPPMVQAMAQVWVLLVIRRAPGLMIDDPSTLRLCSVQASLSTGLLFSMNNELSIVRYILY